MPLRRLYDPDLPLEELMATWPETISVFQRHNMMCVGCLVAPFDTVADACREYGLGIDSFYEELKAALVLKA